MAVGMQRLLLQIIHVSDLHIVPRAIPAARPRGLLRRLPLPEFILQGTAGHDTRALSEFARSVGEFLTNDAEGAGRTWLVATGDFSTWGDDVSVRAAIQLLAAIARRHKIPWCACYGNHDVWDGTVGRFPRPWDDETRLARRRTRLRRDHFPLPWPLAPLTDREDSTRTMTAVRGNSRGRLIGCSLNTVVHEPRQNFWALGRVGRDWYWLARRLPHQLVALARQAQSHDLIIAFTHRPVYDPAPQVIGSVLVNHDVVAAELKRHGTPLVVVSGHTHDLFPEHGRLPPVAPAGKDSHGPLADGHVQLIGGTLSQRSVGRGGHEQTWQLLRFWEDEHAIVLERIVFARDGRANRFRPLTDDAGGIAERMILH